MTAPILRVRLLSHAVGLPAYATDGAAGLDLCAAHCLAAWVYVMPGERLSILTGIAVEIPPGYEGQVRGRSGLAFRLDVFVPQTGTIDSDYRGEIRVLLENRGADPFVVRRGDRIAQLVIAPVARVHVEQVETLTETTRGAGGFGSTGSR